MDCIYEWHGECCLSVKQIPESKRLHMTVLNKGSLGGCSHFIIPQAKTLYVPRAKCGSMAADEAVVD